VVDGGSSYDETVGLFPNNSPTCLVCKRGINLSCLYCLKRAAGEDTDTEPDKAESSDLGALDDPRSKLWKIIVAASAKKKDSVSFLSLPLILLSKSKQL
jgi:hypothetical protein